MACALRHVCARSTQSDGVRTLVKFTKTAEGNSMDRKYLVVAAAALLTTSAWAQVSNRTSAPSRAVLPNNIANLMNAEGTEINATLATALDTRTAKAGNVIV